MAKASLADIEREVQQHMAAIGALFKDHCRLTLVMRNPEYPEEGGFVNTDEHEDDLPLVIDQLNRRWFT